MKKIGLILVLISAVALLAACGSPAAPAAETTSSASADLASLPANIDAKTTAELQGRDDVVLIDVREQWEYDEGHIPGITLVPMNEISSRLDEIPTDKTVIVTCRSGNRSGQVTEFLRQQGYDNVHNMNGGILAWQQAGLPVEQ